MKNKPLKNKLYCIHTTASKNSAKSSWQQTLVLKLLANLSKGQLKLVLPDNRKLIFGNELKSSHQAVIEIKQDVFFKKILRFGHIGFAESYIDGDWETPDIEAVISWFLLNINHSPFLEGSTGKSILINIWGKLNQIKHFFRPNSIKNSERNIQEHYDLGNDFFRLFLDPTMAYSSAYFTMDKQPLEEAQIAKFEAICKKLRLNSSDHVLEIGSGWGGFALYANKRYGCKVTTATISKEQYRHVQKLVDKEKVADKIIPLYADYRRIQGKFDKIVSIEMIEAVGEAYFDIFAAQCAQLLKPDGLLALQMITCPDARYDILRQNVDFIQKHIFPGSLLPSISRITKAFNKSSDIFLDDLESFGQSYAKTLGLWHQRFNDNIEQVKALGFDERFIRKWNYYLLYCKAAFGMANITVVQAIYTRPNNTTLAQEASPCVI
ncbi:MAG: cyclopropane-fatty-acyl-phospholipid synthase family protein [Vampirovibrionales bacterium]|nr:cyclopropane-fatty-acyl-phospholipid synthase family protein [Vampirovibrionales bacterium]